MKLSSPITIRPLGWVLLDIGALLLVVGGLLTIYAIQSGAWNPLGNVTMGIWPFLLCGMWVGIGTAVALLVGFQLAAGDARHAVAAQALPEEISRATAAPEGTDGTTLAREPQREAAELAVAGR